MGRLAVLLDCMLEAVSRDVCMEPFCDKDLSSFSACLFLRDW